MVDFTDSPIEWENESFEDNQNEKWIVKHHIMFLIDASKPMFNTFNNSTFFSTSIEICKSIVMKLLRKSRNDKIGVMLFGTNDDKKTCPKYINVLNDPKKPNIELIKILDNLMLTDETNYGQSPSVPLADALWYSNYLLKKCNENQSCSTIMLITCNDHPNIGDLKKQFNLRKRLDDVIKNGTDFKLIPIGATFNMKMFYEKILNNFNNITKLTNGFENIDDIMSEINEKIKHGRSVSKLKFFIDEYNYISTSLFNFYTKSTIPSRVKLDKRTNKPLVSINQIFTTDTGEVMYKSDLAKFCIISQQKIVFKNKDLSILKNSIIEPGIRLLGFTSKDNILISYHFKTSSFIQPNNEIVESSTLLFNSLLECCLDTNKIIMCYIKVRQYGRLHLAALIPQAETLDDYGIQKYPAGFHVMYLPFFECIRSIKKKPQNNLPEITDEQVSIAKLICEKMPLNYYPKIIKNPKINFHWAMLEAMALELKAPNIIDETLPKNDVIDNNLGMIKNYICEQFFPSKTIPKKKATSNYNNYKKKKIN